MKTQHEANQKLTRELELRAESQAKHIQEQDNDLQELKIAKNRLQIEKDDIDNQVQRF